MGKKSADFIEEVKSAFSEQQEIPYSEVITYFKLLSRIYKYYRSVDVLNMLSICREQNYFYAHILYNIRIALENCGFYIDKRNSRAGVAALIQAKENAYSANTKLKLAKELPKTLKDINKRFGKDIECIKALERLNKNVTQFSAEFRETLQQAESIVRLEMIFSNLCLLAEKKNIRYKEEFEKLDGHNVLKQLTIGIQRWPPMVGQVGD